MKKTLLIMALGLTIGMAACSPTPPEAVPTAAPTAAPTIEIPIPLPPEFFPDGSLPVIDPPVFFPAIECSPAALIDAINRANRDPAHDTIILPPACRISLTDVNNYDGGVGPNGLPVIRTPITIQARYSGGFGVRVQRAVGARIPFFRLFFVSATGELTLDGGYYSRGLAPSGGGVYNEGIFNLQNGVFDGHAATSFGGGIYNLGTVNLSCCILVGNRANTGAGIYNAGGIVNLNSFEAIYWNVAVLDGGGIFNSRAGRILGNSNFQWNSAGGRGGAIFNYGLVDLNNRGRLSYGNEADGGGFIFNAGALTLLNFAAWENNAIVGSVVYNEADATLTNNSYFDNIAHLDGAGIFNTGNLTLINSTMSGNHTNTGPGGIVTNTGALVLSYVTIASNTGGGAALLSTGGSTSISNIIVAGNSGGDCSLGGVVTLIGTSINMDGSCAGFSITADPLLAALANIGAAPLQAQGLMSGSPALDAATAGCPATDQVGTVRPAGTACDIGAIEARVFVLPPPPAPTAAPSSDIPIATTNTLCLWGPGVEYGTVNTVAEGTEVILLGVGATAGWIIIDTPVYPGVACWADEDDFDIDPDIDLSLLPEYPVPPLPQELPDDGGGGGGNGASVPAAPSNIQLTVNCDQNQGDDNTVQITWTDNANNESGFRIYREGVSIGTASANATEFFDSSVPPGVYNYSVEAYNSAGASAQVTMKVTVCS